MTEKPSTRVDRAILRLKNHPILSAAILIGVIIVALGAVAGGLTDLFGLREILLRPTSSKGTSITLTLPSGLTFKQAVVLLADDAMVSVTFHTSCPQALLEANVRPGRMRATTTTALLENLRYRIPRSTPGLTYNVQIGDNGGLYEITCID